MEDFAEIREISHGIRKIPKHIIRTEFRVDVVPWTPNSGGVMVASKFSVKLMISIVGSSDFDIFL
jgi:hypothetical protein